MKEWMLTEEEEEMAVGGLSSCIGKASEESVKIHKLASKLIEKAQSRKIVEWLDGDCPHNVDPAKYSTSRIDCPECMQQFCKEVES